MFTNVCWSSRKVLLILVGFKLNLKFSRQIFEKYSDIKFHENMFSERRVVPWDRQA
jgi:hypothetical protein